MYYVYVIKNDRGKIYIGQTDNLDKRLKRHNKILPSKATSFTQKQGGSWKTVLVEVLSTRQEARQREKQLKSFRGRESIKNLISRENTHP